MPALGEVLGNRNSIEITRAYSGPDEAMIMENRR
jgi:hypothetical protein